MHENDDAGQPAPRRKPRVQIRGLVVGFMIGAFVALVGAVMLIALLRRPAPTITADDVVDAMERWDENGPASYQMTIRVGGNRPGTIQMIVSDGEAISMTRDGHTPQQERTWAYWTVPGQFEMILRDFDSAEDPAEGFGAPAGSTTVFRGRFHPELGYPEFYERIVLGQQLDVRWEVTEFQPRP